MDVLKQSDVDKLFKLVEENVIDDQEDFEEVVQQVFGIWDDTKSVAKQKQDQTLEEMCNSVTDENRQELVDFGKPVGKELI